MHAGEIGAILFLYAKHRCIFFHMLVIKVKMRLHIAEYEICITFSHFPPFYVIIYNAFLAYHEALHLRINFLNSVFIPCLPNLHKMQKLPASCTILTSFFFYF